MRAVDRGLKPTAINAAPTGAGGVTRTLLRRPPLTRPIFDVLPDAIAPRVQPSLERRHLWRIRAAQRVERAGRLSRSCDLSDAEEGSARGEDKGTDPGTTG